MATAAGAKESLTYPVLRDAVRALLTAAAAAATISVSNTFAARIQRVTETASGMHAKLEQLCHLVAEAEAEDYALQMNAPNPAWARVLEQAKLNTKRLARLPAMHEDGEEDDMLLEVAKRVLADLHRRRSCWRPCRRPSPTSSKIGNSYCTRRGCGRSRERCRKCNRSCRSCCCCCCC
jgi:hypothetical protein